MATSTPPTSPAPEHVHRVSYQHGIASTPDGDTYAIERGRCAYPTCGQDIHRPIPYGMTPAQCDTRYTAAIEPLDHRTRAERETAASTEDTMPTPVSRRLIGGRMVEVPMTHGRPVEAPATPTAPAGDQVAELLRGLTDLAGAYRAQADALRGRTDAVSRYRRAELAARAEGFVQAHRLTTAYLRPGAGDGAFALANLMPRTGDIQRAAQR